MLAINRVHHFCNSLNSYAHILIKFRVAVIYFSERNFFFILKQEEITLVLFLHLIEMLIEQTAGYQAAPEYTLWRMNQV